MSFVTNEDLVYIVSVITGQSVEVCFHHLLNFPDSFYVLSVAWSVEYLDFYQVN